MTATKPLPPHGTYGRSVGRPAYGIKGCSCPACSAARSQYRKRRQLLTLTGRELMVPAAPATAHLQYLRASGAGWPELRDATGCSGSTISHVLRGRRTEVRRTVAQAILRVQLTDVLAPSRPVSSLGSVRRIQGLMAMGHKVKVIAGYCNVDASVITHLLNGHLPQVRASTADKIREGCGRLSKIPGSSTRNRNRAAREGWPSIAAWDNIDDPDCVPEPIGTADDQRNAWQIAADRRLELRHLSSYGIPEDEIADRLDMNPRYVHDLLREIRASGVTA